MGNKIIYLLLGLALFSISVHASPPSKVETAEYIKKKLPEIEQELFSEGYSREYSFSSDSCTFSIIRYDGLKMTIPMGLISAYAVVRKAPERGSYLVIECKRGANCISLYAPNGNGSMAKEEFHKNYGDTSVVEKTAKAFAHLAGQCSNEKELF